MSKANIEAVYPLSPMQNGMLFHTVYAPESGVYVEQLHCTLGGNLDVEAFKRAWQQVIDRHGVLRTAFEWQLRSDPLQVVLRRVSLNWQAHDWRGLSAAEQQARLDELLVADRTQGFALDQAPLMRQILIRLDEQRYRFIWSSHHILLDGWSRPLVLKEVFAYYEAFRQGRTLNIELPRSYRAYINWLNQQSLEAAEGFWRNLLTGFTEPTPLPFDRVDGTQESYAEERVLLSQPDTRLLQAFARKHELTLNTILQGAWGLLLSRYSGQADVVFGAAVSGRPADLIGSESMIGLFINTLPVRVQVDPGTPVLAWLARLQAQQVELRQYEYSPLIQVQGWSEVPRGQSLFESIVIFENYPVDPAVQEQTLGITIDQVEFNDRTNYPLNLLVGPGKQLELRISYDRERFDAATIRRMMDHLRQVLTALVTAPEQALGAVSLLTAAERAQLATWNATTVDYPPTSLPALVAAQAARTPQAVAVEHQGQTLTYAQLVARVHQLAHLLRAHGVGTDVPVALAVERSPELLIGALAILAAGGAYVPLDPAYPPQRLQAMLADARPPLLLTQPALRDQWAEFPGTVLVLDPDGTLAAQQPTTAPTVAYDPAQLAYLIYTSGSTGTPKGVAVPHGALTNFLHSMVAQPGLTAEDVLLAVTTIAFDIAGLELWGPLLVGARVVLATREEAGDGALLAAALERSGATVLQATPVSWRLLLAAGWAPRPGVRRWCGGEALPRDLGSALLTDGGTLWNLYGPTETTIWSATGPVAADGGITVGRPIANTQLYVLDAQLAPVPVGVVGEIYIGGTGVARGYNGRPELTATRFVPDALSGAAGARLYWTGDLGRWTADGELVCLGRTDQQVKVRGYRIELGEIETVLRQHPAVTASVVVAREDGGGEQQLVGYVVSATLDGDALTRELRTWLQERLPAYMVPAAWLRLDALPLTPNGKVDRRALPAVAVAPTVAGGDAPRTEAEALLAGIWASVLGRDQVGIHDNFFELGGHSLRATQVLARVREVWGQAVPLRTLFAAPTVAELATVLTAAGTEDGSAPPPLVAQSEEVGRAPLSFAQERFWVIEQLTPGSTAYTIPLAVRLHGVLDLGALEQALAGLVARHAVLRTRVVVVGGVPQQEVVADLRVPLTVVDLREVDAEAQAAALAQAMAGITDAPFELEVGPLLRGGVVRLGAQEQVLVLAFHHSVADGWSLGVALRELAAGYTAAQTGAEPALEALPVQYTDYARWQRTWMQGEVLARELAVWQAQLAGVPALELPTDRPRPPVLSFAGTKHFFTIPSDLTESLNVLSRAQGVTLFMTLLAAFQTLLGRYSGQTDFAVGVPIAGRSSRAVEGLIGCFVNTLVMRADLHGNPSWRTLLRRVRTTTLSAFAHQELPFERLVDALAVERDLSRHPLFQVAFGLQNVPAPVITAPGLTLTVEPVPQTTAKFDLTLLLEETADGLVGSLEYATALFDAATIERMIAHFQVLLAGMVADPECQVAALPMLSADERHTLLHAWNDTALPLNDDRCFHALVADHAARTPAALAVVYQDRRLTYAELDAQADRLARQLGARQLAPEARVGVCLDRGPELIVALLAIMKAGGVYVPLDPGYPSERLRFICADAQLALVITDQEGRSLLPEGVATLLLDHLDPADPAAGRLPDVSADQAAYMIYTSGSTGQPKGVLVPQRGLVNVVQAQQHVLGLRSSDRVLQFAALNFDASVFEVALALGAGATLVLGQRAALLPGPDLVAFLDQHAISVVTLTPSALAALPPADLPHLRTLLVVGEAFRPELAQRWADDRQVFNLYGPTEATIWATAERFVPGSDRLPIGPPIPNTTAYVLDAQFQPVPVGVPGELYLGGVGVARGYSGRAALTATRFVPDPFGGKPGARLYRTGDLARWLSDGTIEFLGRIDHQVKLRGFRIELGEIETVLAKHAAIREATVTIREDTIGDKRLVAYLVMNEDQAEDGDEAAMSSAELRQYLQARLPEYMVPSAFVFLQSLPLTANGKVDRKALPAPELSRSDLEAYVAPRTPIEETLAELWAEVLRIEPIGVHDNFFALGGHSLLATQLVSRVRDAFGIDMPFRRLFETPTIAGLAEVIPQSQAEELDSEQVAQLLAQLEQLSEDEAKALLSNGTMSY